MLEKVLITIIGWIISILPTVGKYLLVLIPAVVFHELGHLFAIKTIKGLKVNLCEIGVGLPLIKIPMKNDGQFVIRLPFIVAGRTQHDLDYFEGDKWQNWKLLWISIAGPLFQGLSLFVMVFVFAFLSNFIPYQIINDWELAYVAVCILTLNVNLLPLKRFNTDGFKAISCLFFIIKGEGIIDGRHYRHPELDDRW